MVLLSFHSLHLWQIMIILLFLSPRLYPLFLYLIELAVSSRRALSDSTRGSILVLPLTSLRVFRHSTMTSAIIQPVFLPLLSIWMVLAMGLFGLLCCFRNQEYLNYSMNWLQTQLALREPSDGPAAPSLCVGTTLISSLHIPPWAPLLIRKEWNPKGVRLESSLYKSPITQPHAMYILKACFSYM